MDEINDAPATPAMRTVEVWAREKRTALWLFAAARAGERWPNDQEVTEQCFDDAIERAAHAGIKG